MGYKISFDPKRILVQNKAEMKKKLEKYTNIAIKKIDEKTPEETKELIGNTNKSEIIEYKNKFMVKIFNDTPYAPYVEYGVGKVFDYHKGKRVFYTGEGAGMFARTINEIKGKFKQLTK